MTDRPERPPFHECEEDHWSVWPTRSLPDGRVLAFELLIFGARIHVVRDVHDMGSMEIYDFQDIARAISAFASWDGTEDGPAGWYRHRPSNRRRTDGDPTKEYIEP